MTQNTRYQPLALRHTSALRRTSAQRRTPGSAAGLGHGYGRSMASGARGFTLLELVVVICLISLLGALAFPVLGRAREMGRRTSCLSNMRQLGLAVHQYLDDSNRRYPRISYMSGSQRVGWARMLSGYTKNEALFQCPSEGHSGDSRPENNDYNYTDYFYNVNFGYTVTANQVSLLSHRDTKVRYPSTTILFGEGYNGRSNYSCNHAENNLGYNFDKATSTFIALPEGVPPMNRHGKGANYAFADGHAKWLQASQISEGYNSDWTNAVDGWVEGDKVAVDPGSLGSYAATFAIY